MCGIFGIVSKNEVKRSEINLLAEHARQRGKDSSGLIIGDEQKFDVYRADFDIRKLFFRTRLSSPKVVLGHSRLITNGLGDNQPVARNDVLVIHNGIVVNDSQLWEKLKLERKLEIDT